MTTRAPEHRCLHCNARLDAHTNADGGSALPDAESVVICAYCAAVMMIGRDLTCRGMTQKEVDSIMSDVEFMRFLARTIGRLRFIRAMSN